MRILCGTNHVLKACAFTGVSGDPLLALGPPMDGGRRGFTLTHPLPALPRWPLTLPKGMHFTKKRLSFSLRK